MTTLLLHHRHHHGVQSIETTTEDDGQHTIPLDLTVSKEEEEESIGEQDEKIHSPTGTTTTSDSTGSRRRCLQRRAVLLVMFCAVIYYEASDGSSSSIKEASRISPDPGHTLRGHYHSHDNEERKCLDGDCDEQEQVGNDDRRHNRNNNDDDDETTLMTLPSAKQTWSHATNSIAHLTHALQDPTVTAIEVDVLMGYDDSTDDESSLTIPVLSHPPFRISDLSFATFFDMVTTTTTDADVPHIEQQRRALQKHIKLDFKELEVIEPVLQLLTSMSDVVDSNGKMIYLNADVLPKTNARLEANAFLDTCLRHIDPPDAQEDQEDDSTGKLQFAFSLGYNILDRLLLGFHEEDLSEMAALVRQHDLMNRSDGVVLAISARLLAKYSLPFDIFLDEFPKSQILAWTTGVEPPVSPYDMNRIKYHYEEEGRSDRIGFDADVAKYRLTGLLYDAFIYVLLLLLVGLRTLKACFS